ncbi:MAG: hypothetical protein ACK4FB_03685 [Brevundimonas sp.]|uniref:hypothetical protein n=1 Tax=Brevundimonas sp. TaxID=1871086 RepID=UPI00391CF77A
MASRQGNHSILCSGLLAAGLVLAASSADAQSAGDPGASRQAGLRTLTWPGKAEGPRPDQPAAVAAAQTLETAPPAPLQIQPSVLPDYTASARPFPQGLTPANAFGSPPVVSAGPAWASTPVPYSQVAAAGTAPVHAAPAPRTPVAQTPVAHTPVAQTPVRSPRTEAGATGAMQATPGDDPMAPRADAPVRRMAANAAAEAAPPAPRPRTGPDSRDGARYYSVHREAGRAPDPATLPAPFFLDSAPVDLAEPPPPPTLMRSQGGLAPSVAGDL